MLGSAAIKPWTVHTSVIVLWMGHEKTDTLQIYVHADLTLTERALACTAPRGSLAPTTSCSPSSSRPDNTEQEDRNPLPAPRLNDFLGIIRDPALGELCQHRHNSQRR